MGNDKGVCMLDSINNKVVIVTGATRGMGLAISLKLLSLGAKVVMVYLNNHESAESVSLELSDNYAEKFIIEAADVALAEDRERIVATAVNTFGRVDALVNVAGIATTKGFLKEEEEQFDRVLDVNLKAPIFLGKIVAKQMIKQGDGGCIINFASTAAHSPGSAISYGAAKAGLLMATKSIAKKLGQYNIRVNSISPGMIKTDMNRYHWENKTDVYRERVAEIPLGRAGEVEDITGAVIYLLSSDSAFTTGIDIIVHGG